MMSTRMHVGDKSKAILTKLYKGGTMGLHAHSTNDDVNYVLSGSGTAICDGMEEQLLVGCCHICPTGSSHSISSTGDKDLVLMILVVERSIEICKMCYLPRNFLQNVSD